MTVTQCGICGKPLSSLRIPGNAKRNEIYSAAWCDTCSTAMTVPQPTDAELKKLYAADHYRLASGRRFNSFIESMIALFRFGRKLRIKKYKKRGSILDVGCGRGTFLRMMKDDGWRVQGLEVDAAVAAGLSAAYDIDVRSDDLLQCKYPEGSYDVITINHVLEHMRKPADVVRECSRLLKPGGLLIVSVPNINSMQALIGKQAWFHLDLPSHLYHFSEKGLVQLLSKCAFRIDMIKRMDLEYGPFGWLQTLFNLSGISKNTFYDLLKKPGLLKGGEQTIGKGDVTMSLLLLPLYAPLSIALSLFETLIRKEGVFEVYAVKQ